MGKKYIIELLDECNSEFKGIMVFGLTQEKQISVELIPEESLRPYTEPDLDAIRNEAYEKGVQDTKQHWVDAPRTCAYKLGYENGLNDAWEAARKIAYMDSEKRKKIFGENLIRKIQDIYSASECIEKIRQYEQRQEERIQVGDEVNAPFGKAIVVNIDFDAEKIWLVYADGHGGFEYFKNAPTKTGRHFPEIAAVLEKMRGEQE